MVSPDDSAGLTRTSDDGVLSAESATSKVGAMKYRGFVVARVLPVPAIVIWIGGIATVTTVVFPAMRRMDSNEQKVWLFEQVERNFRPQARIAWMIVGLTGLCMLGSIGAWVRFVEA
jgi:hypothetical protein